MSQVAQRGARGENAFRILYERHTQYLYFVYCRTLAPRNKQDLEDLVQETFQRVWARAATYRAERMASEVDPRTSFRCWLGRIARNVWIDLQRRPHEPEPDSELLNEISDPQSGSAGAPTGEVLATRLAISELTEKERRILEVYAEKRDISQAHPRLQNEDSKELCEELNMNPNAVRQMYLRAMKKVRARLLRLGVWPQAR